MKEEDIRNIVHENNLHDSWETSVLHEAVERRRIDILRALLMSGVFVDILDQNGFTPLMIAYDKGYFEECYVLISFDANPYNCDTIVSENISYRMKYMKEMAKQFWRVPSVDLAETLETANSYVPWEALEEKSKLQLSLWRDSAVRFLRHDGTEPVYKFQLFNMREVREIHHAIIGQPVATSKIEMSFAAHRAINSSKLLKTEKPLVILLAGPSGHGKSESAKLMGRMLLPNSHDSDSLFIDCSNHTHSLEMFGASGAYQGSKEGSTLNNFIVAHHGKKAVVVLDEFEKTETSTREGFLSVFDTGKYVDKRLHVGVLNQQSMI